MPEYKVFNKTSLDTRDAPRDAGYLTAFDDMVIFSL